MPSTRPAPSTRPVGSGRPVGSARLAAAAALTGALLASAAGVAGVAAPAGAAEVPVPTPPVSTSGVAPEALAAYVPASSCEPAAKPGTLALGRLLQATYAGSTFATSRTCGTDALPTSEHYDGRAVDFMRSVRVPAQKAQVQALLSWLLGTDARGTAYANARRLGVMYLIWDGKIWGAYRPGDGWRPYSSCASHPETSWDTTCHRNHVHVSLSWEGAMGRTSFWTGRTAAPDFGPCRSRDLNWAAPYAGPNPTRCPSYPTVTAESGSSTLHRTLVTYSGMFLTDGSTGPVVRAVQQVVRTTVDGSFGSTTRTAVRAFQGTHALPVTGTVDAATWRVLLAVTKPKPATPAPTPTPAPAPATGGTTTTGGSAATTRSPLTAYSGMVLRRGSRGPAVSALQRRLRVTVDGRFGPRTARAVRTFQRHHHLRVTGVVDARTWRALGA